jgi:deoxycytidine triphosphate deaminase
MRELDAAEAAAAIDPGRWDRPPLDERLTKYFWQDPEPTFHGMLSADRIRAYHYEVGRIIRPFQEQHLKPASYELTLGPRWVIEGETRILTDETPLLVIPPNSIVFVSMREMLLLPHWLVARFDLSIQFIYEGLLLGTGPQVDPGFKGVLSCPLHNISSNPITLEYKQAFAKMDFVKTSFGQLAVNEIDSQEELYAQVASGKLVGFNDEPLKLWKVDKTYRRAIFFPGTAQTVKSSVRELEDTVEDLEVEVRADVDAAQGRVAEVEKRISSSQFVATVTAVALVVTILGGIYGLSAILTNYVDGRVEDSRSTPVVQQLRTDVSNLQAKLTKAQDEQRRLARQLEARRREIERLP